MDVLGLSRRSASVTVLTREGASAALDRDVVLSCVDRSLPWAVLNTTTYAHLFPRCASARPCGEGHDGAVTTEGGPGEAAGAALPAIAATEDARWATALARPLVGQWLIQLCLGVGDAQLRFADDFTVNLEGPIGVAPAVSDPVVPYALEGVALLLPLLNGEVTHVAVSDDGALSLTVGGTTLRCGPDPDFEAWNFTGPGVEQVVSTPGGGLAIWSPRP